VHAFGAWDPQNTVTPEFVATGLGILGRARARAETPEIANRVAKLLLPLWYMQLTYPDRYALNPADGAALVLEFRGVVEANHITRIREGDEDIGVWLGGMEARYKPGA